MATGGVATPVVPLVFALLGLIVKLDGFGGHTRVMPSVFTCGPRGIKHHNKTQGFLPDVKISCTHLIVKVDRSVDITCQVVSGTFAKITWYVNGNRTHKSHIAVNDKTCGQTLEIASAEINDSGNYTCKAANANGTVSRTCALSVREDKTNHIYVEAMKLSGRRQTALLGGRVKLKCNMLNAEVASWLINGKPLIKSWRRIWRTIHTFGQRGMIFTLKISNVTVLDEGWYTCLGYKNGVTANKTFYLKTEACPEGHHCPYNTNRAFRFSSTANPQGPGSSSPSFRNGGQLSPDSPWILIALLTVFFHSSHFMVGQREGELVTQHCS